MTCLLSCDDVYSFSGVKELVQCGQPSPLGMESGDISDGQISASSELDSTFVAIRGRLNYYKGGWRAGENNGDQWLQVDLGYQAPVTGVATQGTSTSASEYWVTKYYLQYSDDGVDLSYYLEPGVKPSIRKVKQVYHDTSVLSQQVHMNTYPICFTIYNVFIGFYGFVFAIKRGLKIFALLKFVVLVRLVQ